MDIDLLSKMVKELILDNDKVVLPGLGSFVAEIVPSTFSDKGYTINPPYRRLYFRSKPDKGDALVEFYASTNNVDKELAEKIIREFVAELRTILHTRKNVVLPGLGRLRATKENNVFFVADEDLDIYPAGFGLEPVSLKTHQETREEVAAAVSDLKSILVSTTSQDAPQVPAPEPDAAYMPAQERTSAQARISVQEQATTMPAEAVQESVVEHAQMDAPESLSSATMPTVPFGPARENQVQSSPAPVPSPTPAAEPAPVTTSVPAAPLVSSPAPVPAAAPVSSPTPAPVAEPVPSATAKEGLATSPARKTRRPLWKVLLLVMLTVILVSALLLGLFIIAAHLYPELVDQLLYTPEELEILNY